MKVATVSGDVAGGCDGVGGSSREDNVEWKVTSIVYYPTSMKTLTRMAGLELVVFFDVVLLSAL
jgi:hypothetical protein